MFRTNKEQMRGVLKSNHDLARLKRGLHLLVAEIPQLPDELEGQPFYAYYKRLSLQAIQYVNQTKEIRSSNLPQQSSEDDQAMVLMVQNDCDKILESETKSEFEKIKACSAKVLTYGAGNCQHKAFVAFDYLISKIIQDNMADFNRTVPLALSYFENHFVVIIADLIVCDPWAQTTFLLSDLPAVAHLDRQHRTNVYEGRRSSYFTIDDTWNCTFLNKKDAKSEAYTYNLVQAPAPVAPAPMPAAEEPAATDVATNDAAAPLEVEQEQAASSEEPEALTVSIPSAMFKRKTVATNDDKEANPGNKKHCAHTPTNGRA